MVLKHAHYVSFQPTDATWETYFEETETFPAFFFFIFQGTSSPEFFTNVIGTFITESDLGIGTIIGTAVFNIFGVIAACGLFTGHSVPLEWYNI